MLSDWLGPGKQLVFVSDQMGLFYKVAVQALGEEHSAVQELL
jgi:hypothetical protein